MIATEFWTLPHAQAHQTAAAWHICNTAPMIFRFALHGYVHETIEERQARDKRVANNATHMGEMNPGMTQGECWFHAEADEQLRTARRVLVSRGAE